MIPKVIHYCWFGGNPLPESVKKCIESWKKYCPEYEIIEWNDSNYDVAKNDYLRKMYSQRKYAFVSDFARLDIIYHYGGIYLDTDVELIKNLDSLLFQECYMGCELPGEVNTGLGFGAQKGHEFLLENLSAYLNEEADGKTCVEVTTALLKKRGLNANQEIQEIESVIVYPSEYFCPLNMGTNKLLITDATYSIHHYDSSWYGSGVRATIKKRLIPFKVMLKRKVNNIFGDGVYEQMKSTAKKLFKHA
ncbi:glycosyltransferase family 32 protein [Streptococcus suis]|uniref:Polysaccharide biosynthesis protein CpsM(V) n=1 Tax=Streptococcus suis TaxID=1307 RepID=A0A0Z8NP33_STRSU|nr:glycosyltransferase [Streptococcus suis]NQG29031.1 glycosyl transferase [Streptococcus suis]CYW30854.1 Polysaccharide biosynthesis protein CpsM(V) [Streptococcus suis]